MRFTNGLVLLIVGLTVVSHQLVTSELDTVRDIGAFGTQTCEENPTHLACDLIGIGHAILTGNYPPKFALRHCTFLELSPHCCRQMCYPAKAATCDLTTGACFCGDGGQPNICNSMTDSTPELSRTDKKILNVCRAKCDNNPNGCTTPATVTDGVSGFLCLCYCSPTN